MIRALELCLTRQNVHYTWTPELDAILNEGYKTGRTAKLAAIRQIQMLTGWPRYACWQRAQKLRLTSTSGRQNRPWSEGDDKYLLDFVGTRNVGEIAKHLKRSVNSVRLRLRTLGRERKISTRVQDGYTKSELATYLGRSKKTIQRWVELGWLKGRYEGKQRSDDTLRITAADFRTFWKKHPWEVPFHRLSKDGLLWFCIVMHDIPPADTFGDPLDRQQRRKQRHQDEEAMNEEGLDLEDF
jgi:hypothetical protein